MGRPAIKFDDYYIPVTETGCWLFLGAYDEDGYGCMSYSRKAHRVSYELHFGEISKGLSVCHKCDTPACINPSHLFLGTNAENSADRVRKGRSARGSKINGKLTDTDVMDILLCDEPCFVIASRYGVSDGCISFIKLGKTWKHVKRPEGYFYKPYRAPATHETWHELKGMKE